MTNSREIELMRKIDRITANYELELTNLKNKLYAKSVECEELLQRIEGKDDEIHRLQALTKFADPDARAKTRG